MNSNFDDYRDWKGWSVSQFADLSAENKIYYELEFVDIPLDFAQIDVFELGFGNGSFLAYCREKGARPMGMERDADLVARAVDAGFEAHLYSEAALQALGEARFDAIVAFDVFEHIEFEELQALLKRLHMLLRPGGIVLARFPSGDSPFSGAMFNGDYTHKTLIGTGKLQQLAISTGFEFIAMRGARLPIRGLGVWTMAKRTLIVIIRRFITALLTPAYYNNASRVLEPNAVGILRKSP